MRHSTSGRALAAGLVAGLLVVACTPTTPVIETGGPTFDGMVPVRDSGLEEAWAKPDIDLGAYRQLLLAPVELQFRAVRPAAGTAVGRSQAKEFPINATDRQRFADLVTEVFREELGKSRTMTLATAPGPDVLVVHVALQDIVSRLPPEEAGRSEIYLDKVGEATLVLELKDAESGETLARAVDRRAADPVDDPGTTVTRVTTVTAWSEVRRVARRWASTVTTRIDQLQSRGRSPGQ